MSNASIDLRVRIGHVHLKVADLWVLNCSNVLLRGQIH